MQETILKCARMAGFQNLDWVYRVHKVSVKDCASIEVLEVRRLDGVYI